MVEVATGAGAAQLTALELPERQQRVRNRH